jgi:hypothetical protein
MRLAVTRCRVIASLLLPFLGPKALPVSAGEANAPPGSVKRGLHPEPGFRELRDEVVQQSEHLVPATVEVQLPAPFRLDPKQPVCDPETLTETKRLGLHGPGSLELSEIGQGRREVAV